MREPPYVQICGTLNMQEVKDRALGRLNPQSVAHTAHEQGSVEKSSGVSHDEYITDTPTPRQ